MTTFKKLTHSVAIAALVSSLGACNTMSRLSEVGNGPQVSPIKNPTQQQGYQQVSMPMPMPVQPPQNANSLWRTGARAFFKDQRAKDVGDILTVNLSINDNATFTNGLKRQLQGSETASAPGLLGYEASLGKILPSAVNPASLLGLTSNSQSTNTASAARSEALTTNIAAVITQVLPNGNLVISGRQEIRVDAEMRELTIQGIVRPEDLSTYNTVTYDKIAEARIYYGGRGVVSDMARPRWGQEILDVIFPF